MIDKGVEVHFANESLDLNSRGGRLSADIQAVVASDFIRNLREETKKGIYGRLKQGLYPFRAVIGYKDTGSGKPKEHDPIQAPLVKKAFELYSTGNTGLNSLIEEMYEMGLRSKSGGKVTRNGLATILHNPFYMGVIRIKATNEMFLGQHEPIISKALFDSVQAVLAGKNTKKTQKHFFIFSRQISCSVCRYRLIAENQKGYIYYRCHTKNCRTKTIREDRVEKKFAKILATLRFSETESEFFRQTMEEKTWQILDINKTQIQQLEHQLGQIKTRLSRLADAYMDGVFDEETYRSKKNDLILEEKELQENLNKILDSPDEPLRLMKEFLELANSAYLSYEMAVPPEKRDLVKTLTSNFMAEGKSVLIKLNLPFEMIANRPPIPVGSPYRATCRPFQDLFQKLLQYFTNLANSKDAL